MGCCCREDGGCAGKTRARRWGALFFFTAGPSRVAFCLAPYIRPVAASVAAVVVDVPCTGRMVFLGCVHALLAVAVLMVRPHRIGWAGCCSVAMDALLVCMIAMTLMPGSESTSRGISWADERDGRRLCRCDHRACRGDRGWSVVGCGMRKVRLRLTAP